MTKPWDAMSESRVFPQAVEVVELADQLGFDSLWSIEHHFLAEYSNMSAPDMCFAYCAARTKQIRFGHGIYLMLPNINHPARVAERIATLDILSNGRIELGARAGATWTELGGFLVEPDHTKEMWEESTRAFVEMWTSDQFSIKGRHFSIPPRNVLPKPVQRPHPPLWVAVQEPGNGGARGRGRAPALWRPRSPCRGRRHALARLGGHDGSARGRLAPVPASVNVTAFATFGAARIESPRAPERPAPG